MNQGAFQALLEELFELDEGAIGSDTPIREIPGWSSLTFVGLIAMIDEECGITLAPNAILSCRTVGDLTSLVLQRRAAA